MRYNELIQKAEPILKNKETYNALYLEYKQLNNNCDKFLKFIVETDIEKLLQRIAEEFYSRLLKDLNKRNYQNRYESFSVVYLALFEMFHPVLNGVLEDKARKVTNSSFGVSNDVKKLVDSYSKLNLFVSDKLIPIIADEDYKTCIKDGLVQIYDNDSGERDKKLNMKLGLCKNYYQSLYAPSESSLNNYLSKPDISLDMYAERRCSVELAQSPWIFIADSNEDVVKAFSNRSWALLQAHSYFAAYSSNVFFEVLQAYMLDYAELYTNRLYDEIITSFAHKYGIGESGIIYKSFLSEYGKKLPILSVGLMPGYENLQLVSKSGGNKEAMIEAIDTLIFDIDNIAEKDIDNIDILKTPIIKSTTKGQNAGLLVPFLFEAGYHATVYKNVISQENAKLDKEISSHMEKIISLMFAEMANVIDINDSHNKKSFSIETDSGEIKGDFDIFVLDKTNKILILGEYKHSKFFRRDPKEAKTFYDNYFNNDETGKAIKQIAKYLTWIRDYPHELARHFGLSDNILREVDVYPLIISNSMEYDGRYEFDKPILINGKSINSVKKISYFECSIAIKDNVKKEVTLKQFVDIAENNKVWKMLEPNVDW